MWCLSSCFASKKDRITNITTISIIDLFDTATHQSQLCIWWVWNTQRNWCIICKYLANWNINKTNAAKQKINKKRMRWTWIEHVTFRSSVWRSPNWAIPADLSIYKLIMYLYWFLQVQYISLAQQVEYFSLVHNKLVRKLGQSNAQMHLSKSIFVITVGSNDMFSYFNADSLVSKQCTPQQYVDVMVSTFKGLLKV